MNEVITFGCRLNTYESEAIKRNLEQSGMNNAIVFNTCAVTSEAERQARQAIRKARKQNPDARIIVTGCSAQIHPDTYSNMPEVDFILGNEEKGKAENYQRIAGNNFGTEKALVNDIMSVTETASHMVNSMDGRARAFVQVQNGCNHRCTFCIIPYGRGNSRSVPIGEIVEQVRILVQSGFPEVVLTGVDITDYGKDLPGTPTLGQMMRRLLALVPDIQRLRLSSIDAAEIDDDLMQLIALEPRLMPHFHISLQAGDDMILKRMKRRHLRHHIIKLIEDIRARRPEAVFGADIIAGFPTETDEMFENTLQLVKQTGIIYTHIFPYSEREGTPAAKMPQVAVTIRKKRAELLRKQGAENLAQYLKSLNGTQQSILVEKGNTGRTQTFAEVELNETLEPGSITTAQIKSADQSRLYAEVIA